MTEKKTTANKTASAKVEKEVKTTKKVAVKKEKKVAKCECCKCNVNKKMGVVKCKITKNQTQATSHKGVKKNWILIDATDAVVGRLGAFLVNRLKGKHLASYTPNTDDGDSIVVINCDKVKFTGNKELQKKYYNHSEYVGNMRVRTAREVREGKRPTDLVRITVARMLGRSKLNYKLVSKNLYLYAGSEHKQQAQNPVVIKFGELNKKNVVVKNK